MISVDVLANLVLGHLIGDFPLQTGFVYRWKLRNFKGVAFHASLHLLVNAILFAPSIGRVWPALVVLFVLHLAQDQLKVIWGGKNLNTPAPFLLDQALHGIVLLVASMVPPMNAVHRFLLPIQWVYPIAGATAATFGGTVFFYTLAQSMSTERHDLGVTLLRQTFDFCIHGLMFLAVLFGFYWLAALALAGKGILWKARMGGPYYSAWMELGISPLYVFSIGLLTQFSQVR